MTVTVFLFAAPGSIVPRSQGAVVAAQGGLSKLTKVQPVGAGSESSTLVASDGPLFCTSIV